MDTVQLSLISHTNVGKTTLARTLLRRDIGQVLDQAHVTEVAEVHPLIETEDAQLLLWDTPGFGDTVRLMRRLRDLESPIGWFLAQVWDRVADRPLWSSQQAARNIQEKADAVLYLVNASEQPAEAGYVRHELDLLTWIGRPVMLLLNQTGTVAPGSEAALRTVEAWRHHVAFWPIVGGVLSLDAFTRCWVQEGVLLERVSALLPDAKRAVMDRLVAAWNRRNRQVFERSLDGMADYLARAATDREALPSGRPDRADKKKAMTALGERLESDTQRLMDGLIALHELEGRSAAVVEKRIDAYLVKGTTDLSVEQGALLGGALSGAVGGLAADMLAGGLTFGGGLVAGAILGALSGAGLTRAHEMVKLRGEPAVSWSPAFLDELARQVLLRYLAVAHFGRGRGRFEDREHPEHWRRAVDQALAAASGDLTGAWRDAQTTGESAVLAPRLRRILASTLGTILRQAYPASGSVLGR
ncbi:MAG: DUF3482 domain-containing protein [Acidobacteria bacterium]|nr:DUF3482 domain-containing protein [Acidobacteriota bacterium]